MRRLSVSARCGLASLAAVLVLGLALAGAGDRVIREEATVDATRNGEVVACERTGLPVDPGFLREVVHDVRFGMYEAEEPLAMAAVG